MAADNRKKRLNIASLASSREQGRAKKKKLRLLKCELNMRSNVSLEWDDKKKTVIAKREQVGLSRRDLVPLHNYVPRCRNILADVVAVPVEIFEFDNLGEVLSYEVWQTQLSQNERKYLNQFLPGGAETHQVVQELLAGDNFHFGNPFLKWGSSLCSGNLHPDAVLRHDQCLKASKRAYYSELQKYHDDMIGNLLMWKERWASCKDPEKEIVQKIWRSRKQAERNIFVDANESRQLVAPGDLEATSESGSWAADEKAGSSDNQNLMAKLRELQGGKGFKEDRYGNLSGHYEVVSRPGKGQKLHVRNVQSGDGSKYMSYIKVSREQHQRVKSSMKQFSNSIQSRSLTRVLGDHYTSHVQPFEVFVEEERKKLLDYWLQLATGDIPEAFTNWRQRQLQKRQFAQALEQEIEEKLNFTEEDEETANCMLADQIDNKVGCDEPTSTVEIGVKGNLDSLLQEQIDGGAKDHTPAIGLKVKEKENPDVVVQEGKDDESGKEEPTMGDDTQLVPVHTLNQQQCPSLSGSHEIYPMHLDSDNDVNMERDVVHPNVSEYREKLNGVDIAVGQVHPLSSTSDVWPPASMPDSYDPSTAFNNEYTSAHELSIGCSRGVEEQPAQLIDLESGNHDDDARKDLLHRQSNDGSFFNPYSGQGVQDQNQLLQHLFRGHDSLLYHHERKQSQLDFQPASNASIEMGQFSGHFGGQLHPSIPLELRQKRLPDMYMHQNIQAKMFLDGGRYIIPRQEHLSAVNGQDWSVNTTHISAPLQSHLDGGATTRNCFLGEHRVGDGWSSMDGAVGPIQTTGNRSTTDQSLFGVLSDCNELRSRAPYDSMGSTERFIQSGTYAGVGSVIPSTSYVLPQRAHPLDYLSGHEAAPPIKNNTVEWMSMPHHNSSVQDSMGKPFLKPWNS